MYNVYNKNKKLISFLHSIKSQIVNMFIHGLQLERSSKLTVAAPGRYAIFM